MRSSLPSIKKITNPVDARGPRGIFSRGFARYGLSNAPKPGNLKNIKYLARRRAKLQGINNGR